MMPRLSVAILLLLCPAVAAGQVFGAGARTEFISGFGIRTFASVETRNRLLVDGTDALDLNGPAVRVRTTPVAIVYGLRSRLSVVAVLPFVDKQLSAPGGAAQPLTASAGGLGDALFLTKWRFYKRDQPLGTFQLATVLGVKAPTGAHDLEDTDGRPLPPALQRGSGSWDPMANLITTYVPAAGRGRWVFTGDIGVRLTTESNAVEVGNQVGYDGMVKYRVHPVRHPGRDTFLLLEIDGRWQDRARVGGGAHERLRWTCRVSVARHPVSGTPEPDSRGRGTGPRHARPARDVTCSECTSAGGSPVHHRAVRPARIEAPDGHERRKR